MEFIKEIFLFEYRVFAWAATAIISIAAIIGSVKTLIESYLSYKQLKLESSDKIESFLNRRNFIKAAVLTSVFSILVISSKRLTKYYKSRKKNFTVIHNKNLIANKKTGIIHLINE